MGGRSPFVNMSWYGFTANGLLAKPNDPASGNSERRGDNLEGGEPSATAALKGVLRKNPSLLRACFPGEDKSV